MYRDYVATTQLSIFPGASDCSNLTSSNHNSLLAPVLHDIANNTRDPHVVDPESTAALVKSCHPTVVAGTGYCSIMTDDVHAFCAVNEHKRLAAPENAHLYENEMLYLFPGITLVP